MERHQFVRENPELARQQDLEGNKSTMRFIGLVLAGVISVSGTLYLTKEELRSRVDSIVNSFSLKK